MFSKFCSIGLRSANCVRMLLAKKADVNAKDSFDSSPLHRAKGYECAKLLVEHGAG